MRFILFLLLVLCSISCKQTKDTTVIDQFHERAQSNLADLQVKQKKLVADYNLSQFQEYGYDFDNGTIQFSTEGEVKLQSEIIPLGTLRPNQTWQWAWADKDLKMDSQLRQESANLANLNQTLGIAQFIMEEPFPCNEQMTWNFVAIACDYLEGDGVYRSMVENGQFYVILKNIDRVDLPTASAPDDVAEQADETEPNETVEEQD